MRLARMAPLLALLLVAGTAAADSLPLVGLSGATDRYVESVSPNEDGTFTIHACAFGGLEGEPIDQPLTVIRWSVLQACCGAVIDLLDVTYNPDLGHAGNPIAGVVSTLDGCRTEDAVWLATMRVRLRGPGPGNYLWSAGPFGTSEDCEGETVWFGNLNLQMIVPGDDSWGSLHARFQDR